MAGNIKGLTIEFRGNPTPLKTAIREIEKETSKLDKEIKQVDKALKFNPTNVDLWRQKQQLLTQKIGETKEKLTLLKNEQERLNAANVDKTSEEYRKLQREIIETESKLKTFEGQLKAIGNVNLRAASEQVKQLGNNLTNAGQAMRGLSTAAAGVTAAIGALTVKSGTWADEMNTMSKKYSISTQDLQKYSAAAELVDVSVETIAKTHVKLEKSMASAAKGTGSQAEAFKALGVSVVDSNGELRNADDVWQETIEKLGEMTNETERDVVAQQLLGKSASELNPLIEDGGETYKRVSETLQKYGLDFIDQETLDRANEFRDELDTIKAIGLVTFQSIGTQLAGYLAPAIEKVVEWIGKLANWMSQLSPRTLTIISAIAGVLAVTAPLLIGLGKLSFAISSILSLAATIGPALGGIIAAAGPVVLVIAAIVAAGILLYKNWDKIKAAAKQLKDKVSAAFNGMKKAITTALNGIKTVVTTVWNAIKTIVTTVVQFIINLIQARFNLMKTVVTTVLNGIKTVVTTVWNAIKTIVTTATNAIHKTVSGQFQAIQTAVTTALNGIKNAVSSAWNAIGTLTTNAWNSIKSKTTTQWNSIKSAITSPIEGALSTIKSIISSIKNLFPINIKNFLSKIKLPHLSVNWESITAFGTTVSYPTGFSVDWYKRGGIFNSPTIAGIGDVAGGEAVVPLDTFWKKLDRIAEAAETNNGTAPVINVYAPQGMDIDALVTVIEAKLAAKQKSRNMAWNT